jgi:GT2 family glycosyltransferase
MSSPPADSPTVSVVTATRNRPAIVRMALASIKAQSLQSFESIVIDDGSDAATLAGYESVWADLDARFRLCTGVAPGLPGTGPSAARNRGIRQARGEFVAFLDDDDVWTATDHLATGVESLRCSGADFFFANMVGARDGEVVQHDWFASAPNLAAGPRIHDNPAVHLVGRPALLAVLSHDPIHPNTVIVRRSVLEEVGGFLERICYGEDYNLILRLVDRSGGVLYRPTPVARYRFAGVGSVSRQHAQVEQWLQMVAATQHLRVTCTHSDIRRCARACEAWTLRLLAGAMHERGRNTVALSLAWQALTTYPTLGAGACFLGALARLLPFRRRQPAEKSPAPAVAPRSPQPVSSSEGVAP